MGRNGSTQKVPYKHMETHPDYVEGCFGCKVMNIGVASVPGGTRPGSFRLAHQQQFDKGLNEFDSARKSGVRLPSTNAGTTERVERQVEQHDRAIKKLNEQGTDTSDIRTIRDQVTR